MNTATARLYETDFYGWIQNQTGMLKAGSFAGLDLKNLIEEIESMGRSEKRELESKLASDHQGTARTYCQASEGKPKPKKLRSGSLRRNVSIWNFEGS